MANSQCMCCCNAINSIGVGTRGALGVCAPQVFAKVNAHYTRVVEERPLYKGVVAAV